MDVKNLDSENLENWNNPLKGKGKALISNVKATVKTASKSVSSAVQTTAKKVETKVKTAIADTKNAVRTIKDELSELAKKGGLALKYAPLIPFKSVMTIALKNKGVSNPPKDIGELAFMFFSRVVKGENSYDFSVQKLYNTNNLQHMSEVERQDTEIASSGVTAATQIGMVAATGGTNPQAIDGMVKAIIDFVKKIMAKKKAQDEGNGAPLSKEEQTIANEVVKTEQEIEQKIATAEAPKNWFKENLPLILVVGAVVIFLIVKKNRG